MTSSPQTPEALLGRNDSKNPETTCKGITGSGRPCRRALASSIGRRKASVGMVALIGEDDLISNPDFYCWQHKDQAALPVQREQNLGRKAKKRRSVELFPLQERDSIDTLAQRLGIDTSLFPKETSSRKTRPSGRACPPNRTETRDFADEICPPQSENSQKAKHSGYDDLTRRAQRRTPVKRTKAGWWASLCCVTSNEDDYIEIVRHRRPTQTSSTVKDSQDLQNSASRPPRRESRHSNAQFPARKPLSQTQPQRPVVQQRTSSNIQTGRLLSLIPQKCSPTTTSALLAELIKPISVTDEDGYIYIFWLTPQSKATPEESTARSLLAPPEKRPQHSRRISDVMSEYSHDGLDESSRAGNSNSSKRTIRLKIGRANNITRRMNEWQRQCGYKLNLVRWYPYISSSTSPSPLHSSDPQPLYPDLTKPPSASRRQSETVRKVPCVKRVERLIHLELAEQRVLQDCEACGKEHREWFEVEANQEGIRAVDDCVRRWVAWAEEHTSR